MLDENSIRTVAVITQRLKAAEGSTWAEVEKVLAEELATLLDQRDTAWEELRKIRQVIHADENESTYDEVVSALCPGAGRGRLLEDIPEHARHSSDEEVERIFREVWLPLFNETVTRDETPFTIPFAVKCELYDYSILLEHVPKVYMEVTGGRVSKPNTVAAAVIGEYQDHVDRLCDEAIGDFNESYDEEDEEDDDDMGLLAGPITETPKSHAQHEPAPTGNGAIVMDAVLKDLEERRAMGIVKYGTPLRTFNGRNALVDAYQESLDMMLYLKQKLMEEDASNEN